MLSNIPAAPLYYQQLEQTFNLDLLLYDIEKLYNTHVQSFHDETDEEFKDWKPLPARLKHRNILFNEGKKFEKHRVYNFTRVGVERKWLQDLIVNDDSTESSSDESVTEEKIKREMKFHFLRKRHRRYFYTHDEIKSKKFEYYSTGLLSTLDSYGDSHSYSPQDDQKIDNNKTYSEKRKYEEMGKCRKVTNKSTCGMVPERTKNHKSRKVVKLKPNTQPTKLVIVATQLRRKLKKDARKSQEMAARRQKLWAVLVKKEILKVQSYRANRRKKAQTNLEQIALHCLKYSRQKAMQSAICAKKIPYRARRLTRQRKALWYDCFGRKTRRNLEGKNKRAEEVGVEFLKIK